MNRPNRATPWRVPWRGERGRASPRRARVWASGEERRLFGVGTQERPPVGGRDARGVPSHRQLQLRRAALGREAPARRQEAQLLEHLLRRLPTRHQAHHPPVATTPRAFPDVRKNKRFNPQIGREGRRPRSGMEAARGVRGLVRGAEGAGFLVSRGRGDGGRAGRPLVGVKRLADRHTARSNCGGAVAGGSSREGSATPSWVRRASACLRVEWTARMERLPPQGQRNTSLPKVC